MYKLVDILNTWTRYPGSGYKHIFCIGNDDIPPTIWPSVTHQLFAPLSHHHQPAQLLQDAVEEHAWHRGLGELAVRTRHPPSVALRWPSQTQGRQERERESGARCVECMSWRQAGWPDRPRSLWKSPLRKLTEHMSYTNVGLFWFLLLFVSVFISTRGIQWLAFQELVNKTESEIIISHLFIKLKHLHLTIQFYLYGPSNVAVGQLISIISFICIWVTGTAILNQNRFFFCILDVN